MSRPTQSSVKERYEVSMKYGYYPGCTLYQQAEAFDVTTRESARALGIELEELENWQCCGAVFPMATDADINLAAPFRALAFAHQAGVELVTVCAGCLNVLRRTNNLVRSDVETRDKLIDFVEEEYAGEGRVHHLLELLRDQVGFDRVGERVRRSLNGLRVAPYYGCLLLRPTEEMAFDDGEDPQILEDMLREIGAEPVEYPLRLDCCGAYLSIGEPGKRRNRASLAVLRSACTAGAEAIVTSCPLCAYNLEQCMQEEPEVEDVPVLYFSQVLAYALGLDAESCGLEPDGMHADVCKKMGIGEVK